MRPRFSKTLRTPMPRFCLRDGPPCEEGQKAYAEGGRAPAHPKLSPIDPIKPEKIYPLGVDDIKEYPKYEKIWKEIFKIR